MIDDLSRPEPKRSAAAKKAAVTRGARQRLREQLRNAVIRDTGRVPTTELLEAKARQWGEPYAALIGTRYTKE